MAAHIEGSRTDTDSVYRDTETNFNIYLITHNVEEPIKDDKEEEEADAWEEKKPKTNKVEKITWDWELCNSSKPIWIRKPNDIEQDVYDDGETEAAKKQGVKKKFKSLTKWLSEDALKDYILHAEISERLVDSPCVLITLK